jgi:hypothetical protein
MTIRTVQDIIKLNDAPDNEIRKGHWEGIQRLIDSEHYEYALTLIRKDDYDYHLQLECVVTSIAQHIEKKQLLGNKHYVTFDVLECVQCDTPMEVVCRGNRTDVRFTVAHDTNRSVESVLKAVFAALAIKFRSEH